MVRFIAPLLAAPLRASAGTFDAHQADDGRFDVLQDVSGRRILLADDTMTAGAHLQSAASALTLHGATVIGAVPIGRLINLDYSADVWERASKIRYDFDTCCLEGG
jgi:orotate phosphoribosyltransferase